MQSKPERLRNMWIGTGTNISRNLYRQFFTWRSSSISEKMLVWLFCGRGQYHSREKQVKKKLSQIVYYLSCKPVPCSPCSFRCHHLRRPESCTGSSTQRVTCTIRMKRVKNNVLCPVLVQIGSDAWRAWVGFCHFQGVPCKKPRQKKQTLWLTHQQKYAISKW